MLNRKTNLDDKKWSRLGRPVYLVDQKPDQLAAAWTDIQEFRRSEEADRSNKDECHWGAVSRTLASDWNEALSNSWLVVEVNLSVFHTQLRNPAE